MIVKHSSIKPNVDVSKISKTVQRDLTIIFDVLSEYVIVNLVFLAVAFRGFISVLSIRFKSRCPALGPVRSFSVNLHVISFNLEQVF